MDWNLRYHFDVDGRTVAWDCWGRGAPVVLLHGTPWSSFTLRRLIGGLAADHEVYTFDLPGYGQSDQQPGDVSLEVQNGVFAALLDHWGLDRPSVVGHDFGGATALRTLLLNERTVAWS